MESHRGGISCRSGGGEKSKRDNRPVLQHGPYISLGGKKGKGRRKDPLCVDPLFLICARGGGREGRGEMTPFPVLP